MRECRIGLAGVVCAIAIMAATSPGCATAGKVQPTAAKVVDVAGRAVATVAAVQKVEIDAYNVAIASASPEKRLALASAHVKVQTAIKAFEVDVRTSVDTIATASKDTDVAAVVAHVMKGAETLTADVVAQIPMSDGVKAQITSKLDLLTSILTAIELSR